MQVFQTLIFAARRFANSGLNAALYVVLIPPFAFLIPADVQDANKLSLNDWSAELPALSGLQSGPLPRVRSELQDWRGVSAGSPC
jgi:hypothetical protein